MAVGTTLKLVFETGYGQKTFSFKHAKTASQIQASDVRNLADTMITNGSIYKYPPLAKVSATLETTTQTTISVD